MTKLQSPETKKTAHMTPIANARLRKRKKLKWTKFVLHSTCPQMEPQSCTPWHLRSSHDFTANKHGIFLWLTMKMNSRRFWILVGSCIKSSYLIYYDMLANARFSIQAWLTFSRAQTIQQELNPDRSTWNPPTKTPICVSSFRWNNTVIPSTFVKHLIGVSGTDFPHTNHCLDSRSSSPHFSLRFLSSAWPTKLVSTQSSRVWQRLPEASVSRSVTVVSSRSPRSLARMSFPWRKCQRCCPSPCLR